MRTFCAVVHVRKTFDVDWKDAVLVPNIAGAMWKVPDDLHSETSAQASINGCLCELWFESAGVRQGSVLGPLLFTILFDSISGCVRSVCPGVSFGSGPTAPRPTSLGCDWCLGATMEVFLRDLA